MTVVSVLSALVAMYFALRNNRRAESREAVSDARADADDLADLRLDVKSISKDTQYTARTVESMQRDNERIKTTLNDHDRRLALAEASMKSLRHRLDAHEADTRAENGK